VILFLLAYLGGVLTIVSPCILPVLPFVFARADRPFLSNGLPLLVAMAVTFAAVATLASVVGGWAVAANQYGRAAALALLALFGLALLFPALAERMTRPLVALGAHISASAERGGEAAGSGVLSSLALGVATGLLWAPCAGPVLGLILTGAALQGASAGTSLLLATYAAGSATSLALALLVGGRVFAAMKRSLGVGEWVRRGVGAAVLVAVAAIAFGLDTVVMTRLSIAGTASVEQRLLDGFRPARQSDSHAAPASASSGDTDVMAAGAAIAMRSNGPRTAEALTVEGRLPSLAGAVAWLNSPPLSADALKGKVVLIDFWTYSCINCLRAIPYVKGWAEKYKDQGLVVIGVHAPEFAFEKDVGNVRTAVADLRIQYPVAIDSNYAIWRAFDNQYWPAHYFIDAQGRIRHHHYGEGDYEGSEQVIQQLLAEAGRANVSGGHVAINATGAEAAADMNDIGSPETYVGYGRAENFASPGGAAKDAHHAYALPASLHLNEWGLSGEWTVGTERATLNRAGGGVVYRFHARDLHLVLGPTSGGSPVRFRVTIDGAAPVNNHGADVDANGDGTVTSQRLYQLLRQSGPVEDRTFEVRFLDPGVSVYAFTFG